MCNGAYSMIGMLNGYDYFCQGNNRSSLNNGLSVYCTNGNDMSNGLTDSTRSWIYCNKNSSGGNGSSTAWVYPAIIYLCI